MMSIIKYILILLVTLSCQVNAEVFKCKLVSGKVIYQSLPCPTAGSTQNIVEIKAMDPQKAEEAKERLKAWQAEQAVKEAAQNEAEKQRKIELDRQESLELQRRSAVAMEQQAIAVQQRQNDSSIVAVPVFNPYAWVNKPPSMPSQDSNSRQLLYDRMFSPMLSHPVPVPAPPPSPFRDRGQLNGGSFEHLKSNR